jgi:hypothetical protein
MPLTIFPKVNKNRLEHVDILRVSTCVACLGTHASNCFVYRLLNQLTPGTEYEMPSSKDQPVLKLNYSRKNSEEGRIAYTSMSIPPRYVRFYILSLPSKATLQPTLCSGILSEKIIVSQLIKRTLVFYGIRRFITVFTGFRLGPCS